MVLSISSVGEDLDLKGSFEWEMLMIGGRTRRIFQVDIQSLLHYTSRVRVLQTQAITENGILNSKTDALYLPLTTHHVSKLDAK